jgi:hypothetical protein
MPILGGMLSRWLLVVLVGCGGGGTANENRLCDHVAKLCDAEDEIASCGSKLKKIKEDFGDSYDKFLDCGIAAKTCGEYIGCAVGGLGANVLDQLDGLGVGMERMMKDKVEGMSGARDSDELPGPCKRIAKVCSPEQPFIRRSCAKLVGNLGEDKQHLAELTKCITDSSNCYALEKCVDQMETTLRGP